MMNAHVIQATKYYLNLFLCRCAKDGIQGKAVEIIRERCESQIKRELSLLDKVN